MDYLELSKQFSDAIGMYPGNRTFGTSFYDQYRNANNGIGYLRSVDPNGQGFSAGQYNGLMSSAKGMKGSAIVGGAMAGINAGTQILGNALQASKIADTSTIENQIDDLSRVGTYGYNNFDELSRDYAYTDLNRPDISYGDIRGMSTGEKIGNIGTSALSGAAAGMQIGGPWGAAVGGVIGAGASLWGVLSGDRKAKSEENFLNAQADLASDIANANLSAAHERMLNNNNRQGVVNAVANGGKIGRKSQTIQEYANKVLAKPRRREMKCGGRITRTVKDDGVVYRIRVK